MDRFLAILATLGAGALVAFQPPANAQLGRSIGVLGAAFISILISLVIIGVLMVLAGETGRLSNIGDIRPEHALGGIAGAAIVAVSIVTVDSLGAGGVVAVTVFAQLGVSAVLDRLGVLGLETTPFTAPRVAGFVLLAAGTLLVTLR